MASCRYRLVMPLTLGDRVVGLAVADAHRLRGGRILEHLRRDQTAVVLQPVRVRETVPDLIFDSATDVVLVDLPTDDLLARMNAGKVYLPVSIERARQNFFRRGNLMRSRLAGKINRACGRPQVETDGARSEEPIEGSR